MESPTTWLARLWQEASQIFDKWAAGGKGEYSGEDKQHPDVTSVAAHLASTKPDSVNVDQNAIAENIAMVVGGMQQHADHMLNQQKELDATKGSGLETDQSNVQGSNPPETKASDPPQSEDSPAKPGKDQPSPDQDAANKRQATDTRNNATAENSKKK